MIKQLLGVSQPSANGGKSKEISVDDLLPPEKKAASSTYTAPISEINNIHYNDEDIQKIDDRKVIPHVDDEMRNSRFFKSLQRRHPEAIESMINWV